MQRIAPKNIDHQPRPSALSVSSGSARIKVRHFSVLVYATPVERVRSLMPFPFCVRGTTIANEAVSLISVISYLDCGSEPDLSKAFEQTSYLVDASLAGRRVQWLLGASIGSLSAIPSRRLWPAPAHLGAMEFKVKYSPSRQRYLHYRLSTLSQWDNADWDLADAGQEIDERKLRPFIDLRSLDDYFIGRNGGVGTRRLRPHTLSLRRGTLLSARSDLLLGLGLFTRQELLKPLLVGVQTSLDCSIDSSSDGYNPALSRIEFRNSPFPVNEREMSL